LINHQVDQHKER